MPEPVPVDNKDTKINMQENDKTNEAHRYIPYETLAEMYGRTSMYKCTLYLNKIQLASTTRL